MLRSGELLGAHRTELFDVDGEYPRFDVPLKRVKKRRVIQQPLSDLAVEIIREALEDGKEHVFASPLGDQSMNRKVMATALRGTKVKGEVKTPGICTLLGLQPFTPHDLRRTAATLAGDLGLTMRVSQNASITPRARSRTRSYPPSPARSTITPSG